MIDLFQYNDYKEFLNDKLDELDNGGRGSRSALSRSIGCHTAYTAQVLRGEAQFSNEQAEGINDFLGHTDEQGDYFLLLVQLGKAGSIKLQNRLLRQIQQSQKSRVTLKNRLKIESHLSEHAQSTYYSSWVYGAVHAAVSLKDCRTPDRIANRLGLSTKQCADILDFLLTSGILDEGPHNDFIIGKKQIHLGSDSPMISRHHINWRLKAMQSIERDATEGLHYTSVVSLSKSDFEMIKEILIQTIQKVKPIIKDSAEEELASFALDFFRI